MNLLHDTVREVIQEFTEDLVAAGFDTESQEYSDAVDKTVQRIGQYPGGVV